MVYPVVCGQSSGRRERLRQRESPRVATVGGGVLDAPQRGTSSLPAIEHIPLRLCTIYKRRGIFLRKKSNNPYKPIDILGK